VTDIKRLFVKNLRAARTRLSLSQAALAARCGLTANYVAELEAARRFPSNETLQKLCDGLGLRPYEAFRRRRTGLSPWLWMRRERKCKEQVRRRLKNLIDELD
jgi:transcriptional regulator with XRE-family HTH domain